MIMSERQIRPSQFITTYGSGAMLPLSRGYVIIPSVGSIIRDLKKHEFDLKSFRIHDMNMETILSRMSRAPNKKFRIFNIPSNADLNIPDYEPLFNANTFPRWSVCNRHSGTPILSQLRKLSNSVSLQCPKCDNKQGARHKRLDRGSSVRFVQACSNGHLDDIDWKHEVHKDFKCNGNVFHWDESSSDNNFTVSCYGYYDLDNQFHRTNCGKSISYFDLRQESNLDFIKCSGLFPELSLTAKSTCDQPAKLVLKNSSNIRLPDLVLAVSIPIVPGKFEFMYKDIADFDKFLNSDFTHKEFLDHCIRYNKSYGRTFPIHDIANSTIDEIKDALDSIEKKLERPAPSDPDFNYEPMIKEEFDSLVAATQHGFPPEKWGEPTALHIEPTDAAEPFLNNDTGLLFKVSPIRKLILTRVQRGYSREVTPIYSEDDVDDEPPIHKRSGETILTHYDAPNSDERWLVGHKLTGEGLFIQLCDPDNRAQQHDPFATCDLANSKSFVAWNKTYKKWSSDPEARRRTNPRFVWWHTISHKIINRLAIRSGFSSASIAERVYCYETNNKHTSGILLYTAQTGGDGTLGGLVSMAPIFDKLVDDVIDDLRRCSNDPICLDNKKSRRRFNGAACHACVFASETSCEYHNKFLDRNIVLETLK